MTEYQQRVFDPDGAHVQQTAFLVDTPLLKSVTTNGDLVRKLLSLGDTRWIQHRNAECDSLAAVDALVSLVVVIARSAYSATTSAKASKCLAPAQAPGSWAGSTWISQSTPGTRRI